METWRQIKRFLQNFRQGGGIGEGMLAGERKRRSTFCEVDVEMTEPDDGLWWMWRDCELGKGRTQSACRGFLEQQQWRHFLS